MQKFNQLDYLEELTQYHRLFYGVFSLGNPVFTTEIETAAVAFNESSGKVDFLLNELGIFELKFKRFFHGGNFSLWKFCLPGFFKI